MSIHQTLFATYANPMIVCDSADFDGTDDFLTRTTGLTGAVDSKSGIFSCWYRIDGGNATERYLFINGVDSFRVGHFSDNLIYVIGRTVGGVGILIQTTSSAFVTGAAWIHVLASWDLAIGAFHLYVNDVSDVAGGGTLTDDTIDYTVASWGLGAAASGSNKLNGVLADLYFAPGQYLDFSNPYFRRKFISASGKPVHLGTTGALPTGTAPIVYQHLDDGEAVANFATNRGTGGDFTINGTLTTGSTSPSD